MATHYIGSQQLLLELNQAADSQTVQTQASRLCRQEVLPRMEALFDRLDQEGITLRIDRLEVDLGEMGTRSFEQDFVPRLLAALEKALSEARMGKASSTAHSSSPSSNGGEFQSEEEDTSFYISNLQSLSHEQKLKASWLFALEHGYLPHWQAPHSQEDWFQRIPAFIRQDETLRNQVRRIIKERPKVALRLYAQLSLEDLKNLWEGWGAPEWIAEWISHWEEKGVFTRFPQLLQGLLIAALHTQKGEITPNRFRVLTREMKGLGDLLAPLPEKLRHLSSQSLELYESLRLPTGESEVEGISKSFEGENSEPTDATASKGQFLSHAGLVLLHPFLPTFFEELDYVSEGKFVDLATQQRAIWMLAYLATGEWGIPEPVLLMAKFLCGWPLASPVLRQNPLTAKEIEESHSLLQAVIDHWKSLKNTSPDGVREGFLVRSGKLEQIAPGQWQLTVEAHTLDILMKGLPWGISMLKLPWMPYLLHVNWI